MKRIILYTIVSLMLAGCGYDDLNEPRPAGNEILVPNTDIFLIRSLCGDGVYHITDDMVIGGYVTANDRSGNIYRSFFIEDETGAAEIKAGMYSLHNVYTRSRYVSVKLNGLSVSVHNGVLQVGFPPSEGYSGVDYIDSWAVVPDFLVLSGEYQDHTPLHFTVPELQPEYCGRLVKVGNIKLAREEEETPPEGDNRLRGSSVVKNQPTWAFPRTAENQVPQSVYRYFEDVDGNSIAVYTSGYANFAGRSVPVERVSITGILSYGRAGNGKEMYILRLRDIDDVALQVIE